MENQNKQEDPKNNKNNNSRFSGIKNKIIVASQNIFDFDIFQIMLLFLISGLLFFTFKSVAPRLYEKISNEKDERYEVSSVLSTYSNNTSLYDNIWLGTLEFVKLWITNSITLQTKVYIGSSTMLTSDRSLDTLVLDEAPIIMCLSNDINERIKRNYFISEKMFETGDVLLVKSEYYNNHKHQKTIKLLHNLSTMQKVGIDMNISNMTWENILSCNFIPITYQQTENMIIDLSNGDIEFAIAPRVDANISVDVSNSINNRKTVTIFTYPVTTAGPVILIKKGIQNATEILESINNFIEESKNNGLIDRVFHDWGAACPPFANETDENPTSLATNLEDHTSVQYLSL